MTRVLLMIDEAGIGGGQSHLLLLAAGLNKEIYDVHVLCGEEGPLTEKLREAEIPVSIAPMSNRISFRSLMLCRSAIAHVAPAILHTHGGTAGFAGRVGSLGLKGVRRVHTYHGLHYLHDGSGLRGWLFRQADRILRNKTDRIICVAQSDLRLGERFGVVARGRSVVIRNGIDLKRFGSTEKRADSVSPVVVGVVGRLHMQKGHCFFLQAASKVAKQFRDIRFRIIGDGELRTELEEQAISLGLHGQVEFRGDCDDIANELLQLDMLVIPSLWEGLPLVLLEAMACGIPVVATNVDGIPEAARDGEEAMLVPPGDSEALAMGITRVLMDRGMVRRITSAARVRVRHEFPMERMVGETADLYQSIVAGSP